MLSLCYDFRPVDTVSDGFESNYQQADSCAAKFCLL